jgi:hypothetical protein
VRRDELEIDWGYLFERLERLLALGEEYLEERLAAPEPAPAAGTPAGA